MEGVLAWFFFAWKCFDGDAAVFWDRNAKAPNDVSTLENVENTPAV